MLNSIWCRRLHIYIFVVYSRSFAEGSTNCHWLNYGHMALSKSKCIPSWQQFQNCCPSTWTNYVISTWLKRVTWNPAINSPKSSSGRMFHTKTWTEPEVMKLSFSNLSPGEIRHFMKRKDSANTQKATKNDVASRFVFRMEVSVEESPPNNLEKLSRSRLTRFLFSLSL